jgi:hypothetical protein
VKFGKLGELMGLQQFENPPQGWSNGMEGDGIRTFLEVVRDHKLAPGHLRGLFHIAIGRTISTPDGTIISTGVSWRYLALMLRALQYDPKLVHELGEDPQKLAPKDRERLWFVAIAHAKVDSPEAREQAVALAQRLKAHGFLVQFPSAASSETASPREKIRAKGKAIESEAAEDSDSSAAKKPRKKKS